MRPGTVLLPLVAAAAVLGSGCTQPLRPGALEPVPLKTVANFGSGTLGVRVSEEARGRESMRAESGVKYQVDLPEWNAHFAADVTRELERRGVAVPEEHEKYIELYLHDIRSDLDGALFEADVHLKVADQSGQTLIDKSFEARHPRMGPALDMALYRAKVALLGHSDLAPLMK